MSKKVNKILIPATSLDSNLLPFTAAVPTEMLPLGDSFVVEKIIEEADNPEEVVFITSSETKSIYDYFLNLKEKAGNYYEEKYSSVSFSNISQKKITESIFSVLRANKNMEGDPFMLSFSTSVFKSKAPLFAQLSNVFRTSEKPVITLCHDKRINYSYVAETEKIASRLYKIRKIIKREDGNEEMPGVSEKCILTSGIFDYLKKEEDVLGALSHMVSDGKTVYAYEADGEWFPLHNYESYLKSSFVFSSKHSSYKDDFKK